MQSAPRESADDRPEDRPEDRLRGAIHALESTLVEVLGLQKPPVREPVAREGQPLSNQLALDRTDLALDRSYMAAERTLQAWIRTALSMISFGFTIGKLGQAISEIEIRGAFFSRQWTISSIAYALVIMGTLSLLAASIQHRLELRRLRAIGLRRQPSIAFLVAILLTVLGGFAFGTLVLNL